MDSGVAKSSVCVVRIVHLDMVFKNHLSVDKYTFLRFRHPCMECPTHEIHEINCPRNNNDLTVLLNYDLESFLT